MRCDCHAACRVAAATARDGVGAQNPVLCHTLGICSALAVTGYVSTTLVMGAALAFVASLSCLCVSLLRNATPRRTRLIVEMLVISTLVILVHLFLKANAYAMSRRLGPYVGLIITNCIILARCENFALRNGPIRSFVDGLAHAAGYALVLLAVAVIREPLGQGTLLGLRVTPAGFMPALLVGGAPGAFLALGVVVWLVRARWPQAVPAMHPEATQR